MGNLINKLMTADGLRRPGSTPGQWDGAFVYVTYFYTIPYCMGLFEDNMPFECENPSIIEMWSQYYKYKNKGWVAMARDDVNETAGIKL